MWPIVFSQASLMFHFVIWGRPGEDQIWWKKNQDFRFQHIKFELYIRYLYGNAEKAVGYNIPTHLKLKEEISNGNTDLGSIRTYL
jgi:hypothetical protein